MTAPPPRSWLLHGGRVHSRADPRATALLVQDGRVVWVGSESAIGAGAADVVTDLEGALVTPAFVDAHVHLTATGLQLSGPDLAGAPSLAVALDRVERATRARRGRVLLGSGWDESRWPEGRAPTSAELDRASYGGVVYLARADSHVAAASSALLAAVPEARTLPGAPGTAGDDLLRAEAHAAVRRAALAALTPGDRRDAQRTARAAAAAAGIGCVHEMGAPQVSSEDDLAAAIALAAGEPGPTVVPYWGGDVATATALGAQPGGDLAVDGSFGARTACLREPYTDDPSTRGRLYLDADAVRDHVVEAVRAGLQPGFHVIGDAAADAVLTGLASAAEALPAGALRAARPRLEHLELLDDEQVAACARLGVVASVQPAFDAAWGHPGGMNERRLGRERNARTTRLAALSEAGVPLALGSDSPVTALAPWEGVRAAVAHSSPGSALSARAAFAAATRGGWRAARRDGGGEGELLPGSPATFAVWVAGDLVVQVPDARVRNWSTDPRAAVPGLPDLGPGAELPTCSLLVVDGAVVGGTGDTPSA